jgi:hypothetical protein
MKDMMIERHPMKGYLKPSEVADMADFLISDKAKQFQDKFLKWITEL